MPEERRRRRERTKIRNMQANNPSGPSAEMSPTVPHESLIFFGLPMHIASGAMTTIFSFLLSRPLFEVSIADTSVSLVNEYGDRSGCSSYEWSPPGHEVHSFDCTAWLLTI